MSVNLVSLAQDFLTPQLIAKIASALGVDKNLTGKAVTALTPGLLGSLAHVVSSQAGAKKLADVIGKQDPSILENVASAIGGPGQQSMIANGIKNLNSLLGGSTVRDIAGVLGKFTGMGQSPIWSLIGIATSAVLGLLGKQKAEQGLDASGLANLLAAQKGCIFGATPSGFADLLGSAGIPGFAPAGAKPAQRVEMAVDETTRAAKSAYFPAWLGWALGLLAAALIAWWLLVHRTTNVVDQTTTADQVLQDLTVEGGDVGSSVQTTIANLKTAIGGISDAASANATLPQLKTDAVAKPAIETLRAKLDALSQT